MYNLWRVISNLVLTSPSITIDQLSVNSSSDANLSDHFKCRAHVQGSTGYPRRKHFAHQGLKVIDKIKEYDSKNQGSALLKKLILNYLWKFAWFFRSRKRLKEAALAFTVREVDQLKNPEAHYLVEELMVRANAQVGQKARQRIQKQLDIYLRSQTSAG